MELSHSKPKLFMVLLGCTPSGRLTEQHDIFFGIANSLKELIPEMQAFWPEANGKIHVDAWRTVTHVGFHQIEVVSRADAQPKAEALFFINLGGYRPNEFDEPHYKILSVASNKSIAIKEAKQTGFYKHTGFKGAASHIDDKFGVDVDDVFEIEDILPAKIRAKYALKISVDTNMAEDEMNLGYLPLTKIF